MKTYECVIESIKDLNYPKLDFHKQFRNETKFKETCLKNRLKRKKKKK